MNRREFLLALGIAGCGTRATPTQPVRRRPVDAGIDGTSIVDDWASPYQLRQSPLIVYGAKVARRTETELAFFDTVKLHRIDGVAVAYRTICADHDVVLAFTRANGPCTLERFEGVKSDGPLLVPGGCTSGDGSLMIVAGSSLFLSIGDDVLAAYRLEKDTVAEDGRIRLDDRTRDASQLVGLADGRLLFPAGRSVRVYRAAKLIEELKSPARIAHLAAGTTGRIWYSAWNEHDHIDRVVLAKLENGLPAIASIEVRVVHLAAGADGGLAILTVEQSGWSIVVLDRDGVEKQRIRIPPALATAELGEAFVALSATSVLLETRSHGLSGWSLATGAPL